MPLFFCLRGLMYHPTIWKLDAAAADFHELGLFVEKDSAFRLAGQLQQSLQKQYPKTGRRYLHAQWVWALGHIGLLHQLLRYFRMLTPEMKFVLEANGSANPWFLQAIHRAMNGALEIFPRLRSADEIVEAQHRAVYFGCPDGVSSLKNFYKMIERECVNEPTLVSLSDEEREKAERYKAALGVSGEFVAVHARWTTNDEARNARAEDIEKALESDNASNRNIVLSGLDAHPLCERYPSIRSLPAAQQHEASFLLSATCEHFIGSDSGAWTIAHAFRRPVTLVNDYNRSAWIYP